MSVKRRHSIVDGEQEGYIGIGNETLKPERKGGKWFGRNKPEHALTTEQFIGISSSPVKIKKKKQKNKKKKKKRRGSGHGLDAPYVEPARRYSMEDGDYLDPVRNSAYLSRTASSRIASAVNLGNHNPDMQPVEMSTPARILLEERWMNERSPDPLRYGSTRDDSHRGDPLRRTDSAVVVNDSYIPKADPVAWTRASDHFHPGPRERTEDVDLEWSSIIGELQSALTMAKKAGGMRKMGPEASPYEKAIEFPSIQRVQDAERLAKTLTKPAANGMYHEELMSAQELYTTDIPTFNPLANHREELVSAFNPLADHGDEIQADTWGGTPEGTLGRGNTNSAMALLERELLNGGSQATSDDDSDNSRDSGDFGFGNERPASPTDSGKYGFGVLGRPGTPGGSRKPAEQFTPDMLPGMLSQLKATDWNASRMPSEMPSSITLDDVNGAMPDLLAQLDPEIRELLLPGDLMTALRDAASSVDGTIAMHQFVKIYKKMIGQVTIQASVLAAQQAAAKAASFAGGGNRRAPARSSQAPLQPTPRHEPQPWTTVKSELTAMLDVRPDTIPTLKTATALGHVAVPESPAAHFQRRRGSRTSITSHGGDDAEEWGALRGVAPTLSLDMMMGGDYNEQTAYQAYEDDDYTDVAYKWQIPQRPTVDSRIANLQKNLNAADI